MKVCNQLEGKTILTEISTKSGPIWQFFGPQPFPSILASMQCCQLLPYIDRRNDGPFAALLETH
jgi:hypothetical protein